MYKNILSAIDGISIYPLISFSIFFSFFLALGWFVWKADKSYIRHMEELPFGESDNQS
ncbi:MAG: CcoQ/FixQ family Cbb3-type cytochrome c oxidase assembly chaperone [Spirosomataceae bacterium]